MSEAADWRHLERLLARGLPDLLVIDWQPVSMSVEALRIVRQSHAALAIAVITDAGDAATVGPLVRAGALGVIPRDLEPRLILRALEFVLLGGYYVPVGALGPDMVPGSAGRAGTPLGRPLSRSERADRAALLAGCRVGVRHAARAALLSPRQQQIMRLVHLGNTNKTIARVLEISEGTVKIHLAAVFRLLGAANRAAAVALYNGWQYAELQSSAADSRSPGARDEGTPLVSSPSRLATGTASYETRARSGRRGERSPPYLIAAQPNWPFAPRRGRGEVDLAETDDDPAAPRSREFQAREGATPRGRARVAGAKRRTRATCGAQAGRVVRPNELVRTEPPAATTEALSRVSAKATSEAFTATLGLEPTQASADTPCGVLAGASSEAFTATLALDPTKASTEASGEVGAQALPEAPTEASTADPTQALTSVVRQRGRR